MNPNLTNPRPPKSPPSKSTTKTQQTS
jgi:hypothetical protein